MFKWCLNMKDDHFNKADEQFAVGGCLCSSSWTWSTLSLYHTSIAVRTAPEVMGFGRNLREIFHCTQTHLFVECTDVWHWALFNRGFGCLFRSVGGWSNVSNQDAASSGSSVWPEGSWTSPTPLNKAERLAALPSKVTFSTFINKANVPQRCHQMLLMFLFLFLLLFLRCANEHEHESNRDLWGRRCKWVWRSLCRSQILWRHFLILRW